MGRAPHQLSLRVMYEGYAKNPEDPDAPIPREGTLAVDWEAAEECSAVLERIDAQMRTLPEIDDMWSDSKHGRVILHAETRDEVEDLDFVWQRVRNKMSDIKPHLPAGTIGPFVNDEFGLVSVADIALTSDGFSMAEMRVVARDIRDRLYEIRGVRKIDLYGVHNEQIFLDFSTTRLAQFGITGAEVIDTLVKQNVVVDA